MKQIAMILLLAMAALLGAFTIAAGPALAACQQYTATNSAHVTAGRAYTQSSGSGCSTITTYYAIGSNESLGTSDTSSTTLYTNDNGTTYRVGSCPAVIDADGDGYDTSTDCNDNNANIHPGATEICGDGIDQDCSGADLACSTCQQYSATNDAHVTAGRAYTQSSGSGCSTTTTYYAKGSGENMGTSGTASTTLYTTDGGANYRIGSCPTTTDADKDGYPSTNDCNDNNASIHPGATEICGDGIDQDCNGTDAQCQPVEDKDNDGHYTPGDCNDNDRTIHPLAHEVCGDGIDQNCDGSDQSCGPDNDGDGFGSYEDCNNFDSSIYPGAVEICGDGIDQDCNGLDLACLPGAPSCVTNLGNWKIKFKQKYSDCMSCHTTCTPGGHSCTVGGAWGSSSNCMSCHSSAHF